MTRTEFICHHVQNMPFAGLVDFIYWDNHGDIDRQPSEWTMAMVIEYLAGSNTDCWDWDSFASDYARFLEETQ